MRWIFFIRRRYPGKPRVIVFGFLVTVWIGIKNRQTNGNFCACFVPIYRNVYDHSLITNLMSIMEQPCSHVAYYVNGKPICLLRFTPNCHVRVGVVYKPMTQFNCVTPRDHKARARDAAIQEVVLNF